MPPQISAGDTAWVLTATALVMLMTPALALFYGGLVRRKNVLSILMQCMFILALVSVTWVLVGYTLAFGKDFNGWGIIGGLDNVGLKGVGTDPGPYAKTIPASAFALFQMMFAIITPALIIGAFAERKRFKAFVLFALLWSLLVYSPVAHWVWGDGGWLRNMGLLDYAGGTVVHISSGVAALVAALVLGPRVRRESDRFEPHDVRLTVIGAGILWFGWFGFNGGSALAADGHAVNAVMVTNTAAGMGALTWLTMSWLHKGSPSIIGAVSGAIAGEVGITPASGFVDPSSAIVIGFLAGAVCYGAILLRERLKIDDALDVWAVHGVGGTLGVLLTGVLAVTAIGGAKGLVEGNVGQVGTQLVAIVATWIYSAVATLIILKVVDRLVGLRVEESEEEAGLDFSQHGEVVGVA
ncbi:MAG TPA: ammonium transporter [Terriglobales bacterium]|nr:ammonium transporter [Terriglobales bacterium]